VRISTVEPGLGGSYRLELNGLHRATGHDRDRAATAATFFEAEQQRQLRTETGRRAAVDLYGRAVEGWIRLGDSSLAGIAARRRAQVLSQLGELDAARTELGRALELLEHAGQRRVCAGVLNDLGRCERLLGSLDEAEKDYEQALQLANETGYDLAAIRSLESLATVDYFRGDADAALRRLEDAVGRAERVPGAEALLADALEMIAATDAMVDRLDHARSALDRAAKIRVRVGPVQQRVATMLQNGWICSRQGDLDDAITHYDQALELAREHGLGILECGLLDRKGTALRLKGLPEQAAAAYDRAMELAVGHKLVFDQANIRCNQAELELDQGRLVSAEQRAREAVVQLDQLGDRQTAAHARWVLGRALAAQGQLEAAREELEQALEALEYLRRIADRRSVQLSLVGSRMAYLDLLVEVLMRLHKLEPGRGHELEALAVTERARARHLLDLVSESGVDTRGAVDPALLGEEHRLQKALQEAEAARRQIASARGASASQDDPQGSGPLKDADGRIAGLLDQLDRVEAEIRRTTVGVADIMEPPGLDLAQVRRRLLGQDTAAVVLWLGEAQGFVWLIEADTVTVGTLPPRAAIRALVASFHEVLVKSHTVSGQPQVRQAEEELGSKLLDPIADRLQARRLLVVPDDALIGLPFAALAPGSGEPLLIEKHELVLAWSLASLEALQTRRESRPVAPRTLAVIGDPVLSLADPRVQLPTPSAGAARIDAEAARSCAGTRLPFAAEEVQAILGLVPPDQELAAVGPDATRQVFLDGRLAPYRIIHVATHGRIDTSRPELSEIALSCADARGRLINGHLPAYELYHLQLNADLVVLSACDTALGKEVRGEGLIGLTHGLLHAGASAVVVSLWKVNDHATAELMTTFYTELLEHGQTPAAALRQAQLEALHGRRWSAPFFWAGFVLAGDGSAPLSGI